MSDSLAGRNVRIGGGLVSSVGGFIYLQQNETQSTPHAFDVGRWSLVRVFEETLLDISGALGATDSRRSGHSYRFELDILMDLRNPIVPVIRFPGGCSIILRVGEIRNSGLADRDGTAVQGTQAKERYYWAPEVHIDTATTVLDAATKKVVKIHVVGHSVSHMFLVPDEGEPDASPSTDKVAAYKQWYENKEGR